MSQKSKSKSRSKGHGVGWDALAAAVVIAAVYDVVESPSGSDRADARAFLESSACDHLLDLLGLPSNTALLARIKDGISPDLRARMGGSYPAADLHAQAQRMQQHRRRRRAIEYPLLALYSVSQNRCFALPCHEDTERSDPCPLKHR